MTEKVEKVRFHFSTEWEYHRPVVAGWYFWQRNENTDPEVVLLECSYPDEVWYWRTVHREFFTGPAGYKGRWFGPLTLPYVFEKWRS